MNSKRTILYAGPIVIALIILVVLLWGPVSGTITSRPSPTIENDGESEASGSGFGSEQSTVELLKPAGGQSFELNEVIEFEWCWYETVRSSDQFVIFLTAAHHEQSSVTSPEPTGENCYRFITKGSDIASLPGTYELQMKAQKNPSQIVLGESDRRKIVLFLDGSLVTPTPTHTNTPTPTATSTPRGTATPLQPILIQPTTTSRPTSSPTNTPRILFTDTPTPTPIPPSPTNTQPPPPPPPPKPTSPPPPATSTPPLPPPPEPTNPPAATDPPPQQATPTPP